VLSPVDTKGMQLWPHRRKKLAFWIDWNATSSIS